VTETLRQVLRAEPFAAARDFDDLVRFHVWQSRIGVSTPADDAVRNALARSRGIAVVGPPGSGKTSTLAVAALDAGGIAHRHVPVTLSVMGSDVAARVNDPRYLAERLVRAVTLVDTEAADLVDDAALSGTATRAAVTWRAQVGRRYASLSRELRQRTEALEFERSPAEVLDAARAAIDLATAHGIRLVVLLEDADGLLRLPGQSSVERHEIANAFFLDGLAPLIRELPVPMLVAVQPDYRELEGFQTVVGLLDSAVDVPVPPQFSDSGVRLLLSESLRTAGINRQLTDMFSSEALSLLCEHRASLTSIRHLLQVCDRSLVHALTQRRTIVEIDDVLYALTQD
jgi:hypothetical protein